MKNQQEKLVDNQKLLDAQEKQFNLPEAKPPGTEEELQEYLSMSREVIEKLSPEKIWSISVRLSQFAFYIQRNINRNNAIIKYAEHEINKIVSQEIKQFDKFTKHEVKVYQICRTNSAAIEALKIKIYAEQTVDRLTDLASGLKNLSYIISMPYKHKVGDKL